MAWRYLYNKLTPIKYWTSRRQEVIFKNQLEKDYRVHIDDKYICFKRMCFHTSWLFVRKMSSLIGNKKHERRYLKCFKHNVYEQLLICLYAAVLHLYKYFFTLFCPSFINLFLYLHIFPQNFSITIFFFNFSVTVCRLKYAYLEVRLFKKSSVRFWSKIFVESLICNFSFLLQLMSY